jgi:hypothetical protein
LRGWSINVEAANRKKKHNLIREFDALDRLAENQHLDQSQIKRMDEALLELNKMWAMEETEARQRSRDRNIIEGDKNTRYFHTVANQRRRKTTIYAMEDPEGMSIQLRKFSK